MALFYISQFNMSVFPRIEKLEKENNLLVHCKKNGWRDLSHELEECRKVLEEEAKSESRSSCEH